MKYQGFIKKSRTLDKETLLALAGLVGVMQQNLPMVQGTLGHYYGWVMIGFAVMGYWLRFVTKGPVGEKPKIEEV